PHPTTLHPFPTRRSSDLASQDEEVLSLRSARLQEMLNLLPQGRAARIELAGKLTRSEHEVGPMLDLWLTWWRDLLLVKGGCADRSEEHTSELQSLAYLVC